MIIDRIQLAGLAAYFQNGAGGVNLGGQNPLTVRTKQLGRGKQLEISAIELLIASDGDLTDLFHFNVDTRNNPPIPNPLFSITLMKEMFPMLFADPFRHRVHTIGGFEDFKRGTMANARVMDIDGIPTIVSIGTGICIWKSPLYSMPEPIRLNHAAWELAASTKTPKGNFKYSLKLDVFGVDKILIKSISLADDFDPTTPRKVEYLDLNDVGFYQLEFTADVKKDASLYEKHTILIGESIGTPLLRAVNLLEAVESTYNIYSLQELLSLSSQYHLFEFSGQPIKKMLVTLDLSATLVHSEYERIANNDSNDPDSVYEFVELSVKSKRFSIVEARLVSEILQSSFVY